MNNCDPSVTNQSLLSSEERSMLYPNWKTQRHNPVWLTTQDSTVYIIQMIIFLCDSRREKNTLYGWQLYDTRDEDEWTRDFLRECRKRCRIFLGVYCWGSFQVNGNMTWHCVVRQYKVGFIPVAVFPVKSDFPFQENGIWEYGYVC